MAQKQNSVMGEVAPYIILPVVPVQFYYSSKGG